MGAWGDYSPATLSNEPEVTQLEFELGLANSPGFPVLLYRLEKGLANHTSGLEGQAEPLKEKERPS